MWPDRMAHGRDEDSLAWNSPEFQRAPCSPFTPILLSDLRSLLGFLVTIGTIWTQVATVPGRKRCYSRASDIFRDLGPGVDTSELPSQMDAPLP